MKKGEIWVVELPYIESKEQAGIRPALIISDTKSGMIVILSLTSNIQALRFPNTIEIKKSLQNGLEKDSIALLFHIRSIDFRRLIKKVGNLEDIYVKTIDTKLKEMMLL